MLESFSWLVKKEELELCQQKFTGKLAGVSWKYAQNIDGLIRTRIIIYLMAILVFYPVFANYAFHGHYSADLFFERVVFSLILFTCGLLFNKYRIGAIVVAAIPILLIMLMYMNVLGAFDARRAAFMLAVLVLILAGIYHHVKAKRLKEELDKHLLENHIIDR